uniref:Uncharacterized protein n=1 Tax=Anopheles dirus TaxID=7168 RepID=A0A182NVW8_9DIPT
MKCVVVVLLVLLAMCSVHECITVLLPPPNYCPRGMQRDHKGICRRILDWSDSDAISA